MCILANLRHVALSVAMLALLAPLQEARAAEPTSSAAPADQTPVEKMGEMREYANDPDIRGIGIFINLQHDATMAQGEKLGQQLKAAFAGRGIPVEFRINQSRGTATDFTFYLRDYAVVVNFDDVPDKLGNILAHHGDLWPTNKRH